MSLELWNEVDRYLIETLHPADPVMEQALQTNASKGLPPVDVAPNQGKLLYLLARIQGAKRILEVGTLGGYSTLWFAKALPADGRVVTLEVDRRYAEVARENFARSGLGDRIDLRMGPALESLVQLEREDAAPFDLVFIDADKRNNSEYLKWALRFSRVGTIIVADNVVRDGAVTDRDNTDASVQGIRGFLEAVAREPRLEATAIQTVGKKGYDGFALAIVTAR